MKILFFGIYDPSYSRTRILMKGLRRRGVEVEECRVDPAEYGSFGKFRALYRKARALNDDFDYVLVSFPGHSVVWLARWLFGKRRIIWDAYVSIFDVNVYDRKLYSRLHPKAWRDYIYDRCSAWCARYILFDTDEHITRFRDIYGGKRDRFIRVLIGADDEVMTPLPKRWPPPLLSNVGDDADWNVHFHGSFIPVQGLTYIVEAAKILEDEGLSVRFIIVGGWTPHDKCVQRVKELNIEHRVIFAGKVLYDEVPRFIASSDICLGIFGDTEKAQRVIPNKVYEYAAMAKPIITSGTPAIREVFVENEHAVFVNAGDSAGLATKIKRLMDDSALRSSIAKNAYTLYKEKCTPEKVVEPLLDIIGLDKKTS